MAEKFLELRRGNYQYYRPIPSGYQTFCFDRDETIQFVNKELFPVKAGDVINLITQRGAENRFFNPMIHDFNRTNLFNIKKEDEKMKNYVMLCRGKESFIFDNLDNNTTEKIIFTINDKFPIKFGDVIKYCYFIDENNGNPLKFCSYIIATIGNCDMENIREHMEANHDNKHLSVLEGTTKIIITKCMKCVDGKPEVYDDIQYINKKENKCSGKRKDYISWHEYFMGVANLAAYRSKDPSTQVGACIVDTDNTILSIGYNGFPRGCSDDEFPWGRDGNNAYDTKYMYVAHAELNAILNSNGKSLKGSTLYVSLFPCNECAKAIIQSGIKHIIYQSDKYADSQSTKASKRMLDAAGVEYIQLPSTNKSISLNI